MHVHTLYSTLVNAGGSHMRPLAIKATCITIFQCWTTFLFQEESTTWYAVQWCSRLHDLHVRLLWTQELPLLQVGWRHTPHTYIYDRYAYIWMYQFTRLGWWLLLYLRWLETYGRQLWWTTLTSLQALCPAYMNDRHDELPCIPALTPGLYRPIQRAQTEWFVSAHKNQYDVYIPPGALTLIYPPSSNITGWLYFSDIYQYSGTTNDSSCMCFL